MDQEEIRTLTVDVHPDGLDGRGSQAVLGLAVVAAPLGPQDLCDVQRLVEHAGVLEAVRHAARCLGPPDLRGRNDRSDCRSAPGWLPVFRKEAVNPRSSSSPHPSTRRHRRRVLSTSTSH